MQHALLRHPDSPAIAVDQMDVAVTVPQPGRLALRYRLIGKIDDIIWPVSAPTARHDGLWQHTCFEAFLRRPRDAAYCEFNFSPSTEWAAYAFTAYRAGMAELAVAPPQITPRWEPEHFFLDVQLDLPKPLQGPLTLALTAVIAVRDGTRSYWALHHPAGKPDFHHREGFTLEIGVS